MTPDGQFRDPATQGAGPGGWLDRVLARVGGVALLMAIVAGGLVLAALAVVFVSLLLPVLIVAGLVAAGSIWWRVRRMRAAAPPGPDGQPRPARVVIIRR
jgi:hypothetical protein